jgi:hypothetical protein
VKRLQQAEPLKIEQQQFETPKGEVLCPLFYVQWGKEGEDKYGHPLLPVTKFMISGINGELLSLLIENDTYAKRPMVLIKNVDKLLAIPDSAFVKYSPEQRRELVARFSAIPIYSNSTNKLSDSPPQTNAIAQTNAPPVKKISHSF